MKSLGLEIKITLPYQDFEVLKTYCQINKINILNVEFLNLVNCNIELSFNEKDKIMYEIDKKKLNIQNIEIIKEKNIRKM